VDSTTAWNDLKTRRQSLGASPFEGKLNSEDIGHAVARLGFRLSTHEAMQVCMRINPSGTHFIDEHAFHGFAARTPKFMGEIFNAMEADILKDLLDVYRYSGKKNRERFNKTLVVKADDPDAAVIEEGYTQFEEALDEVAKELNPDEKGQLPPSVLMKNLLAAVGMHQAGLIDEEEVVALAQYVGADDVRTSCINVRKFLEGVVIYAEQLKTGKVEPTENYSLMIEAEDEEALLDVCIDVQQFLHDKARLPNGTYDYQKAFDLFDEDHSGSITLIELKHMLEKLGIMARLEERTVLKLMERFDTSGEGLVTADEFKSFAERPFVEAKAKVIAAEKAELAGKGGSTKKSAMEADPIRHLQLDKFQGKITGDRLTDQLVIDIMKAMLTQVPLEKLDLQILQRAFLGCDPDRAGVITRQEFFIALSKAKIALSIDTYNATKLLEFFLEDEDLLDYEAIIHAVSRLRHLIQVKYSDPAAAAVAVEKKTLSITGRLKLDNKLITMKEALIKLVDAKENREASALRRDPYRVFFKLDDDHDGMLTLSEFRKGLEKLALGVKLSDAESRSLFRRLDKDGSHRVDYREFIEFFLGGDLSKLGKKEDERRPKPGYEDDEDDSEDDDDDLDANVRQERIYKKVFGTLVDYEPNDTKRKTLQSHLKKFDRTMTGNVSERRFRAFLYKCQIDVNLDKVELRWLIRELDPDMTGNIDYVRFYERLLRLEAERELAKKKEDEEKKKIEELEKKKKAEEDEKKKKEEEKRKQQPLIDVVAPILKRIFEGINVTALKGKPYHVLFALSDELNTGLVSK